MPYTPTTPTLTLCAALASYVQTQANLVSPDVVDWDFFRRFGDADDLAIGGATLGKQVIFFPATYDWELENRGQEEYTHHVYARVVERYAAGAGDPPRDWTGARVDWVHTYIAKGLRFQRGGPPSFNSMLLTLAASVEVYDAEKLIGSGKLFYALVELKFSELVS